MCMSRLFKQTNYQTKIKSLIDFYESSSFDNLFIIIDLGLL